MFGSYVMDDLCLILFPVAYIYNHISAERLESSECRQNSGGTTKPYRASATAPLSSRSVEGREAFMI